MKENIAYPDHCPKGAKAYIADQMDKVAVPLSISAICNFAQEDNFLNKLSPVTYCGIGSLEIEDKMSCQKLIN